MRLNKQQSNGFTIIEVLIVLAIAGLILLVVFLAVPALQRNSRDTSRKSDASRILGAAQEVLNNHNGKMTSLTSSAITGAAGDLGYYASTDFSVSTTAAGTGSNSNTADNITLWPKATCDTNGEKAVDGTNRQIAITYKLESGGGTLQCKNS